MRHTRALAPYAALSAAIVVVSAAAIAATVRDASRSGAPEPTPGRAVLSDTARIAYWRAGPQHALDLWVGDLEGPRKWTIATADDRARIHLTRWSPDGSAVAYLGDGGAMGVAHVDGTPVTTIALPTALLNDGWRITSLEWSPDASRVAATVRSGRGIGNDSDVYVASANGAEPWRRLTTIGDAFAAPWIDGSRMLIETASGMIATLDVTTGEVRPLTGMPAASPILARDGRVYFIGGRFVRTVASDRPYASGWVWSSTVDGDDVRREDSVALDQVRLHALLADGRAVVGAPGSIFLARDQRIVLSFRAGSVRSVEVSDDGRQIVGWTGSRVLRIDASKVAGTPVTLPSEAAATVLLDGVADADAWFPRSMPPLAHAAAAAVDVPAARLAYVLDRAVWVRDPGGASRIVGTTAQYFASQPRWSPDGQRLAVVTVSGFTTPTATVVVTGAQGTQRWTPPGLDSLAGWTPDGRGLVFVHGGGTIDRGSGPQPTGWKSEIRAADTGAFTETVDGRLTFAGQDRVVLTDGSVEPGTSLLLHQRVEIVGAAGARTVTDADRLASELPPPSTPGDPYIERLVPMGEPGYVGVSLRYARAPSSTTITYALFAVVRTSDGHVTWSVAQDTPTYSLDLSASPVGAYVGWTEYRGGPGPNVDPSASRAHVADPLTGRTLLTVGGRFAGWSPDPAWIYVARDEGLFGVRIADGRVERVGPIGVPVTAARP